MTYIGLIVIFGIVMLPVYGMLLGWFFGRPRDPRTSVVGLGYVVGFTSILIAGIWIGTRIFDFIMHL